MAEVAQPTHAEVIAAFEAGQKATNKRLDDLAQAQADNAKAHADNAKKLDEVIEKQAAMTEIIQTWDTLKTGGRVITSSSKFAAAVLVLIALFKTGLVGFWEGGK